MRRNLPLLLLLTFLLGGAWLCAQPADLSLADFNAATLRHQRLTAISLGGWALTNIGLGLALRGGAAGSPRYFHEMNALWNGVNLAIAGAGYFLAARADPAGWDLAASLREHQGFQRVLLFNAGLDVGYVAGGLYLTERARRPGVNGERLRGYGRAIMLQGGFLLAFDLVNYFLAASRDRALPFLLRGGADGLGLSLWF